MYGSQLEMENVSLRELAAVLIKRQLAVDNHAKIFDGAETNE